MLWIALITLPLASAVLSKDSAVTLNTRGVLETVKHANDSKLVQHAGPRAAKERSLVMVDAGSSGSKLSSYHGADSQTIKVLTDCTNTNMPLKGVSALAYDMKECDAEVHVVDVNKQTTFDSKLVDKETYAAILLEKLRRVHECGSLASTCEGATAAAATNRGSIPILATAGMRLLTEENNAEVWSKICGKSSAGYTFASDGNCGTISGTQEAYYEFLAANLETTGPLSATVTIGGESAQIAVPLRDNQKLKWFADLYGNFTKVVKNCKSIQLPNGDEPRKLPIPTFNKENCARDFIDIRLIPDYLPTSNQGYNIVGLISLLGLEGLTGGIGVAGGMNAIEKWARREGCGAPMDEQNTPRAFDFNTCEQKLQEHLQSDHLFSGVKDFFQDIQSWDNIEWNIGTPAAIPSKIFTKDEQEAKIGQEVGGLQGAANDYQRSQAYVMTRDWLEQKFRGQPNERFGVNNEQTVMKALFQYEYFAAVIFRKVTGLAGAAKQAGKAAKTDSLKFNPLGWTDGKLAAMAKGEIAPMSDADFQSVLKAATGGWGTARTMVGGK
mmetsp:Transcript_109534/g.210658  ORF Transcript_109534/g.210658 Transcript_109534/m.210658 type:complete len:554 (+) Transcript_109534:82-1743(+)